MNLSFSIRGAGQLSCLLLGSLLLFGGACSSSSSGSPGSGGSNGSGGSSSGGKTGSGGSASGGSGSGGNGSGGSASGGSGSGGSGSGGSASGGSASGGSTSGGSGSGGSASGGTSSGGSSGGESGNGGAIGSGGAAGGGSGSGGAGSSACPANAFFCSGFEDATLPTALVYKVNAAPGDWSRDYALDTTVHNSGKASLRVKASTESGTSGSSYKMLSVPAAGAFWVRFYIQSEMDIGGLNHNAFAAASGSDDPNDGVSVEFAEDVGVAFNSKDDDRWPTGYGRTMSGGTNPYTLPKNAWHCIEISYNGQGQAQQLYVNSTLQIDAKTYPAAAVTLKVFKFGFMEFHGPPRKIWYDDIVVAPSRAPCL